MNDMTEEKIEATAKTLMLAAVGVRVNQLVKAIQNAVAEAELSNAELDALGDHTSKIESIGHITDPTGYRELLNVDGFRRVKERIKLIRAANQLAEMEKSAMSGAEYGE